MILTNDQYNGLSKLLKWYQKYSKQFIEISGTIGTGVWDLIQEFFKQTDLDQEDIIYLSLNQKQIVDLAFKKYHIYHLDNFIYNYSKIVNFDTLPVLNRFSKEIEFYWKKEVNKKTNHDYKIIVVFDSFLLNYQIINDLASFGLPIILLRDPMLLPAPDTYTFLRDANINLYEINDIYSKSPIIHFAHKIINNEPLKPGSYDTVSVIRKKDMNLYNLKSSDMILTTLEDTRNLINNLYRQKIMKCKDLVNVVNERVIISETIYKKKLTNQDEKKIKIYFAEGTVGHLIKVNKHVSNSKYVGVDFQPEFYHETFTQLMMDRHHLNKMDAPSNQLIPEEIVKFDYAYALTIPESKYSYWNKVTLIDDTGEYYDHELRKILLYTGIVKSKDSLSIII